MVMMMDIWAKFKGAWARLSVSIEWLAGLAVVVLGAIFLSRRSGAKHDRDSTRSSGAARQHAEMADIALEGAQSEAKTADQQHELAVEAAKPENREEITVPSAVKRARQGRKV